MKQICSPNQFGVLALSLVSCLFISPAIAMAAAPDGAGPWADAVVSIAQGLMKNGLAVPALRSNPTAALGVAEQTIADGTFYSLGFGGSLTLKFTNTQSGGAMVVESTNPGGYPIEKAKVDVSEDGSTWVTAGSVNQSGSVSAPKGVCVQYVRVTDISNKNDFSDATADGYDVDGVKLTGNRCTPKEHSGGGSTTTVTVNQNNTCLVSQSSSTNVLSVIKTTSNTGGNSVKNSTGGNNRITTGSSTSSTSVNVTGGSNVSGNPCGSCGCSAGPVSITIEGNN